MKANILFRTKCYTIGAMEYENGADWRELVENILKPRNITVFNPYKKPFLNNCDETPDVRQRMRESMMNEDYEKVTQWARDIRRYDLNLVDRSDFIIANINPSVASWGTAEELSTAVAARKPIFTIIQGGVKHCPLWLMGQLKYKYMYNNFEDALNMLTAIDEGLQPIDSPSWRLLRPELR